MSRGSLWLFLSVACLAGLVAPDVRAQSGPPPFVNSANNSADYSTTIAQGSLFVVFGENLGPAGLVEVSAFPLPKTLAGTSITVTSGSATLDCPMIYTSAAQVAAILPSNTPAGARNHHAHPQRTNCAGRILHRAIYRCGQFLRHLHDNQQRFRRRHFYQRDIGRAQDSRQLRAARRACVCLGYGAWADRHSG